MHNSKFTDQNNLNNNNTEYNDSIMSKFAQFHEKWKEIVFSINKTGNDYEAYININLIQFKTRSD